MHQGYFEVITNVDDTTGGSESAVTSLEPSQNNSDSQPDEPQHYSEEHLNGDDRGFLPLGTLSQLLIEPNGESGDTPPQITSYDAANTCVCMRCAILPLKAYYRILEDEEEGSILAPRRILPFIALVVQLALLGLTVAFTIWTSTGLVSHSLANFYSKNLTSFVTVFVLIGTLLSLVNSL